MLSALSGPALALLISLPGIPGFHFPGFSVKHRTAAPRDTIPPPWKPASMLALEDQFVLGFVAPILAQANGMGHLQISGDTRQLQIAVDQLSRNLARKAAADLHLHLRIQPAIVSDMAQQVERGGLVCPDHQSPRRFVPQLGQ